VCTQPLRAVRFGELPKVERKVLSKMTNKAASFDHTAICTEEIGAMLVCFEAHAWDTVPCKPEVDKMDACVELHKLDPVSSLRRA